jgi:hypothetical protein
MLPDQQQILRWYRRNAEVLLIILNVSVSKKSRFGGISSLRLQFSRMYRWSKGILSRL